MTTDVLRTADGWWVDDAGRAIRVETAAATTAQLLGDRTAVDTAAKLLRSGETMDAVVTASLEVLSPITTPCRVVAQMVNYRSHARESGFDPARVTPTFFRKASGSVVAPTSPIVYPDHVRLLDYEVELGLVVGAPIPVGAVVTRADLPDLVAGVVLADDVSARDVQLSKGQFYESKSYPTFTPLGPRLVLLEPAEFSQLAQLRLQLSVNGAARQDATVADMICPPAEALSALTRFQALAPGDVVLTGTPGGTALQAPPAPIHTLANLLPARLKWKLFFRAQARKAAYLRVGDRVVASIRTPDGRIDLGRQDNVVVSAAHDAGIGGAA